ncbi:hypothetical protein BCR34DRAFT_580457 [Clohesyomyces aquaticus]|uniref:Uncharacterized protein n=1 Tax=Clohesyomyces aquaticus TaxID=1231657 RepID=A0A1Y1Y7F9_9PLEO|nr:hypothetical protein BCR34DRAFT_580457 [Clohesyomyces aquaticus]
MLLDRAARLGLTSAKCSHFRARGTDHVKKLFSDPSVEPMAGCVDILSSKTTPHLLAVSSFQSRHRKGSAFYLTECGKHIMAAWPSFVNSKPPCFGVDILIGQKPCHINKS